MVQPNQYIGMMCGGCREAFSLGERVVSHGTGLVHVGGDCAARADARATLQAAEEVAQQSALPAFYGVYSDGVGETGVYYEWEEVARLVSSDPDGELGISFAKCDTEADAREFIRTATASRATGVVVDHSIRGSVTRRTHLAEKLSDGRVRRITECIAGKCGIPHGSHSRSAWEGADASFTWRAVPGWGRVSPPSGTSPAPIADSHWSWRTPPRLRPRRGTWSRRP